MMTPHEYRMLYLLVQAVHKQQDQLAERLKTIENILIESKAAYEKAEALREARRRASNDKDPHHEPQ